MVSKFNLYFYVNFNHFLLLCENIVVNITLQQLKVSLSLKVNAIDVTSAHKHQYVKRKINKCELTQHIFLFYTCIRSRPTIVFNVLKIKEIGERFVISLTPITLHLNFSYTQHIILSSLCKVSNKNVLFW